MRNSRNIRQNQAAIQNRIKQFRGRVGQRLVGKDKLKASSRRRFYNGVSPLNRDNVQPSYTQYNSNNGRQNRFFQQRGLQFSQNQSSQRGYHQQRQPARGQRWNVETRPSSGHVVERRRQDTSFQTEPIIRGRLKNNFGFMRSDTIAHKQQLHQNLQQLQLQQQQQQHQQQRVQQQQLAQKSWQRLKPKVPQQLQSNSARTAIYEPSSTAAVTILIPNIADSSSDVSVIFGKKSKRNRQNAGGAFGRSVAIQQPADASRPPPKKFGNRNQSVVSFEEDLDVNVETASGSPVNSLPFHLVSRKPAEIAEDLDCGVLIV